MNRKTVTLMCLLLARLLFAREWIAESYYCKANKFARRVEIRYKSAISPLPCRSIFFRDIENYKIPHILFRSRFALERCERRASAYLKKLNRWHVLCERDPAERAEELGRREISNAEPGPETVGPPQKLDHFTIASPQNAIVDQTKDMPASERPKAIQVALSFSQAVIDVQNNGSGTFASDAFCPGIGIQYQLQPASRLNFVIEGQLKHMGFHTSSPIDSFVVPSPWLWRLTAGVVYPFSPSLAFQVGPEAIRRNFIYRAASTQLAADQATIPDLYLQVRYRLPLAGKNVISFNSGAAYLFSLPTRVSVIHPGASFRGLVTWENSLNGIPVSLGFHFEKTLQNTSIVTESTLELGLLFGVEL